MEERLRGIFGVCKMIERNKTKVSDKSVIIKMNGGLGNQMFQWAVGRMIETTTDFDVYLDMSYFKKGYARPYQLNVFKCEPKFVDDIGTKIKLGLIWAFRDFLHWEKTFGYTLYSEKSFNFDPGINKITEKTYIEGFFQSELYFKNIENLIREDFKFVTIPNEENNKTISKIMRGGPSISLHVRRGDYVTKEKNQEIYAQCSIDYYNRAVEHIAKTLDEEPVLYIFSDDMPWTRRNLKFPYKCIYVGHNKGKNSYEDMRLMTYCNHNIIANSSFSWWGAWLNENPTKIVVAPKKWFNDESIIQTDATPKEWVRLDN